MTPLESIANLSSVTVTAPSSALASPGLLAGVGFDQHLARLAAATPSEEAAPTRSPSPDSREYGNSTADAAPTDSASSRLSVQQGDQRTQDSSAAPGASNTHKPLRAQARDHNSRRGDDSRRSQGAATTTGDNPPQSGTASNTSDGDANSSTAGAAPGDANSDAKGDTTATTGDVPQINAAGTIIVAPVLVTPTPGQAVLLVVADGQSGASGSSVAATNIAVDAPAKPQIASTNTAAAATPQAPAFASPATATAILNAGGQPAPEDVPATVNQTTASLPTTITTATKTTTATAIVNASSVQTTQDTTVIAPIVTSDASTPAANSTNVAVSAATVTVAEQSTQPAGSRDAAPGGTGATGARGSRDSKRETAATAQTTIDTLATQLGAADGAEVAANSAVALPTPAADEGKPATKPSDRSTVEASAAPTKSTPDTPGDMQLNSPAKLVNASTPSTNKSGGAQTSSLSDVDRVRFVQRVARAVQSADVQGGPVRIRLSPPELGAMKLEVTVRNGVLSARMEAETPQARTALLDNLPALRDRLAEQKITVDRFDVDLMNQQSQGGAADNPYSDLNNNLVNRNRVRSGDTASDVSPVAASGAVSLGNNQLNIVI